MPIVQSQQYEDQGIAQILGSVLKGVTKGSQDKAYRSSIADMLGVPVESLGHYTREELEKIALEKHKADIGPWKARTKAERLEEIDAEYRGKIDLAVAIEKEKRKLKYPDIPEEPEIGKFREWKRHWFGEKQQPTVQPTAPVTGDVGIADTLKGLIGDTQPTVPATEIPSEPEDNLRVQAIQALKDINYPITAANIEAAMKQLRGE